LLMSTLSGLGVAKLTMTLILSNTAMKLVNHSDIDDDVRRPGNVQTLYLQVSAFVSAASRNTLAAVGTVSSGSRMEHHQQVHP
jgi:hypothetical protein